MRCNDVIVFKIFMCLVKPYLLSNNIHSNVKYSVYESLKLFCIFIIHPLGMKLHFTSFADNYANSYITLTAHVAELFIPLSSLLSRNKMLYLISAYNSA